MVLGRTSLTVEHSNTKSLWRELKMLMTGDMNKILTEVNKVLEVAFNRIQALEDRLMELEAPTTPAEQLKRGPGRPPGSKNKKAA
jgi:hypothetical protein